MECLVQEDIMTENVNELEILLRSRGICRKRNLKIHELFLSGPENGKIHILCDLQQAKPSWTVRYGNEERIIESLHVQNFKQIQLSEDPRDFFYGLGFSFTNEILKVGYAFHFQSHVPVTVAVTCAYEILNQHAVEEVVLTAPVTQLVEVSAPSTTDNYNEVVATISSLHGYLASLFCREILTTTTTARPRLRCFEEWDDLSALCLEPTEVFESFLLEEPPIRETPTTGNVQEESSRTTNEPSPRLLEESGGQSLSTSSQESTEKVIKHFESSLLEEPPIRETPTTGNVQEESIRPTNEPRLRWFEEWNDLSALCLEPTEVFESFLLEEPPIRETPTTGNVQEESIRPTNEPRSRLVEESVDLQGEEPESTRPTRLRRMPSWLTDYVLDRE